MAYAVLRKRKRLANPGRRKRRMSPKQIAIFGTKRQKAALRSHRKRKSNPRRRRRNTSIRKAFKRRGRLSGVTQHFKSKYKRVGRATRRRKRRKNVGSLLVATIPGNPGRKRRKKKTMARRRRRRTANPHRRRRHYNARRRRRSNPGSRRRRSVRTVIKYRTRGRRHHNRGRRRRNPGMGGMSGDFGAVLGVVAGATVNSFAMGFVPAGFNTGIPGYIASAVIAVLQGQIVGKALRKPAFGKQMTIGGLTYTAIKVINDFFPTLSLGLSGLGAIAPTAGFFSPQVNTWGSMGTFQTPGTVMNAIAAAGMGSGKLRGLGEPNFSSRRVGRIQ